MRATWVSVNESFGGAGGTVDVEEVVVSRVVGGEVSDIVDAPDEHEARMARPTSASDRLRLMGQG